MLPLPVPSSPGLGGLAPREGSAAWELARVAPVVLLYLLIGILAQPGADPIRDEPALLGAAERLLDGHLAGTGADPDQRAYLWHGPGLVVLLAPLVALDLPLEVIRLSSPLLLGGAVLLFHQLLREHLDRRAALRWTYALGLYAPFAMVLGTVQKEPLAVLLVVAGLLALSRGLRAGRRSTLAGAGVAFGALAMVRLEYGWVLVALLAIAVARPAFRRDRPSAVRLAGVAAVAVLACVPWLAYTHRETGESLYWSASSGLSLFWMSPTLPGETGQWHSPLRVYEDPVHAPYRPLFRRLDEVHPLVSDRVLTERALANIRARPAAYARNIGANVTRLFFWAPTRTAGMAGAVGLLVLFNGALLFVAVRGGRALWRRRRSVPPETGPIALFALLALAVHIPPSASPRMLLPLVPVLLWLAAVGAAQRRARTSAAASPASTTASSRYVTRIRPRAT